MHFASVVVGSSYSRIFRHHRRSFRAKGQKWRWRILGHGKNRGGSHGESGEEIRLSQGKDIAGARSRRTRYVVLFGVVSVFHLWMAWQNPRARRLLSRLESVIFINMGWWGKITKMSHLAYNRSLIWCRTGYKFTEFLYSTGNRRTEFYPSLNIKTPNCFGHLRIMGGVPFYPHPSHSTISYWNILLISMWLTAKVKINCHIF